MALPKLFLGIIIILVSRQLHGPIKLWGPLEAMTKFLCRFIILASNWLYDPICRSARGSVQKEFSGGKYYLNLNSVFCDPTKTGGLPEALPKLSLDRISILASILLHFPHKMGSNRGSAQIIGQNYYSISESAS